MPSPFVIAFSGATKTGKTSISSAVAAALQCGRGSFGDAIRSEALSQGIAAPTREELQAIGDAFVTTHCGELCVAVLTQALWEPGRLVVLDGVRHSNVLRRLSSIVAPQAVKLVLLKATPAQRLARIEPPTTMTLEELQMLDSHPTEWEVHHLLPRMADLSVCGKTQDETIASVLRWVHSQVV